MMVSALAEARASQRSGSVGFDGIPVPLRTFCLLVRNANMTLGSTFFKLDARFSTRCQLRTAKPHRTSNR